MHSEGAPQLTGYALWLIPEGEEYQRLTALIQELSKKYGTPPFEPHITLIYDPSAKKEEWLEKAQKLASGQKPFSLKLARIGQNETFYQALFQLVESTESLERVCEEAVHLLTPGEPKSWMPHLSLLYGYMSDKDKKALAAALQEIQRAELTIDKFYLVDVHGEPENWKHERVCKFGETT